MTIQKAKSIRAAVVAATVVLPLLAYATAGCSSQPSPLLTKAPPPSNPNLKPEMSPNKRMPMAPPTMGGGPQAGKK